MSKLLCGIACLFLSAAAYADEQVIEKPLVAQSLAGFDQEATEIRAGMHQGGRYEFLKADDKSKIEARLSGSHVPVKTCRTYGDIEAQRADAMKTHSDLDKSRVNKGGG